MLCDIGYIIKDHIPAMMQLMTDHIRSYNMQLLTTKCLNTAVMMWYLFLGERTDVMNAPETCDSKEVRERGMRERKRCGRTDEWAHNDTNPCVVVRRLRDSLLEPQEATQQVRTGSRAGDVKQVMKRTLYYVMLTTCKLRPAREHAGPWWNPGGVPFPGHVFVVEKVGGDCNRYNLFQSYINEYTLSGHSIYNRSFAVSEAKIRDIMRGIERMYTEPTWSAETTAFWKRFSHVDTSGYEGYRFCDESYVCFRTADTSNCVHHLARFLKQKLTEMSDALRSAPDAVYGDASRYNNTDDTGLHLLSNREMREEIETMLAKI